jgi:hypothetical protein
MPYILNPAYAIKGKEGVTLFAFLLLLRAAIT